MRKVRERIQLDTVKGFTWEDFDFIDRIADPDNLPYGGAGPEDEFEAAQLYCEIDEPDEQELDDDWMF